AMGLIIPVLPKLILDFLGGEMTDAAKWSARFAVVFALMQFFFSPLLGVLSDRFGRRPVILLSNLGLGLDYIVMAMAPTLSWLFLYAARIQLGRSHYFVRITNFGGSQRSSFLLIFPTTSLAFGRCTPSIATVGVRA